MFTPTHQRQNRHAVVNVRVSMSHHNLGVADMSANHPTAWTFGYIKSLPRPVEHSP